MQVGALFISVKKLGSYEYGSYEYVELTGVLENWGPFVKLFLLLYCIKWDFKITPILDAQFHEVILSNLK